MQKVNFSHFCSTVYAPLKTRDTIFEFDKKKSFGVHLNVTCETRHAMHLCWKRANLLTAQQLCLHNVLTTEDWRGQMNIKGNVHHELVTDCSLQEAPGYASIAITRTNKGRTLPQKMQEHTCQHSRFML